MNNYLYHFFPRKFESEDKTVSVLESIIRNGLFLSKEILSVNWKDVYAIRGIQRKLEAEQFRFCLTAITNKTELKTHSSIFGSIGLEFQEDTIVKMGGFPVFYVPTPQFENACNEEYKGVSLLYRLADAQQVLDYVIKNDVIQTKDIDLINVLGAIKFLANICYPTQRKRNFDSAEINYYNQREWRIIHNLTSENVKIGKHQNCYTVVAFNNEPIRNFITRIIVFESENISKGTSQSIYYKIGELINYFKMDCKLEYFNTTEP